MKIKSIELVTVRKPAGAPAAATTPAAAPAAPRRPSWTAAAEVANPMSKFARFKPHRSLYSPKQWPGFHVKVTAEDGTWGIGPGSGRPAAAVIADAYAHILTGEECLAVEMRLRLRKTSRG